MPAKLRNASMQAVEMIAAGPSPGEREAGWDWALEQTGKRPVTASPKHCCQADEKNPALPSGPARAVSRPFHPHLALHLAVAPSTCFLAALL